jgi:Zn-dependent M32 family carboxypeptidase
VITYKSAVYKVGYNIADHIEAAFYDEGSNSVTVRTENLKPVNNLVKLIWTKAKDKQDFAALKDYFSPIVSLLGFRFN